MVWIACKHLINLYPDIEIKAHGLKSHNLVGKQNVYYSELQKSDLNLN
jgi:hypothetical protein